MRRILAYAILLIVFLTLAVWFVDLFIRPIIPQSLNSSSGRFLIILLEIMALLANLNEIIELTRKFREMIDKPLTLTPVQKKHNRKMILNKVQVYWIEGVLEASLHGAILLQLGMRYQSEMVKHPWDAVIERPHHKKEKITSRTNIYKIYERFGGSFLILGDPGSGKTTTLLELTRELIKRALQDETHDIPVVFNLSTWGLYRGDIRNWLISELHSKYQVPVPVGTEWIDNNELILLLDGLDEVSEDFRKECVDKINEFIQDRLISVIITSRLFEYKYLSGKLAVGGAMVQQPLSTQQIDRYLKSLGSKLNGVRKAIETDKTMRELAQTPLVLSIIAMTYQGMTLDDFGPKTKNKRIDHLFEAYIKRMFKQRKIKGRYNPNEMVGRLIWLAKQMRNNAQTIFRIEQLQPTALSRETYRNIYMALLSIFLWVSVTVSFGYATGISIYYLSNTPIYGMLSGVLYGITGGLGIWIVERGLFKYIYRISIGIITGLAFASTVWIFNRDYFWSIIIFLIIGITLPFLFGRIGLGIGDQKAPDMFSKIQIRRLDWSLRACIIGFVKRMPIGIFIGLAGGLAVSGTFGLMKGILVGFGFMLATSIVGGLAYGTVDLIIEHVYKPNEGTWRMLKNGLIFGLGSGMAVGVILGFLVGNLTSLTAGLISGLSFFCATFIIGGTVSGGLQVIQHAVLRALLYFDADVPLNYPLFLDRAVNHIFLRNVGSGYIFIHRLLLDFFASKKANWAIK